MSRNIHPSVYVLRKEILENHHPYAAISQDTGITLDRLKNILTGRADMSLWEGDMISAWLGLSPFETLLRRHDLRGTHDVLDLTRLTPARRQLLLALYFELLTQDTT